MRTSSRVRGRGTGALAALLAAMLVWACTAPHSEQIAGQILATADAVSEPSTVVSEPGPLGEVVELAAPSGIVQTAAFEASSIVTGLAPENPLVQVRLVLLDPSGAPAAEFPPTLFDPGLGAASWSFGRDETAGWSVGDSTLQVFAMFASGDELVATSALYVGHGEFVVMVDGAPYRDGDELFVSCGNPIPTYKKPSTGVIGTPVPGGPPVLVGPVLTTGGIVPPNENEQGEPVLGLSPQVGTEFTLGIQAAGQAQVQFQANEYFTAVITLTVVKPAQAPPPDYEVSIEGIIFNWDKGATSKDAINVRMYGHSAKASNNGESKGDYPDDLIHAPLYRGITLDAEKERPAWRPERENEFPRYHQDRTADDDFPVKQYQDSAAVYVSSRTAPPRAPNQDNRVFPIDIRVLFRIKPTNLPQEIIDAGVIDVPIRVKGEAKDVGAGTKFWDDQEFSTKDVTFDLTPTRAKGHNGHQHSLQGQRTEPGGGNDDENRSIKYLRDNYVIFPVKVKRDVFDQWGYYDEKLVWEYKKPDGTWVNLYYQPPHGTKSNKTLHRTYTLLVPPREPWREIPFVPVKEGSQVLRPMEPGSERQRLLTSPNLPWLHVLDELLAPVSVPTTSPFELESHPWRWKVSGNGAIGGFMLPEGTDDEKIQWKVAERTTIFVNRNDKLFSSTDWARLVIPAAGRFYFLKKVGENLEEFSEVEADPPSVKYNGQSFYLKGGPLNKDELRDFKFAKLFFDVFSRKKRAEYLADEGERKATLACYDVAATNRLFARLLGARMLTKTDRTNSDLRIPHQLWGDDAAGTDNVRPTKSDKEHFKYHSYNTLFTGAQERTYDALVTAFPVIGGRKTRFPVVGISSPLQELGGALTVNRYRFLVFKALAGTHKRLVEDQKVRIR